MAKLTPEDLKSYWVWIVWAEQVDPEVAARENLTTILTADGRCATRMTSAALSLETAVTNVRQWITDGPTGLKTVVAYAVSSEGDEVFGSA